MDLENITSSVNGALAKLELSKTIDFTLVDKISQRNNLKSVFLYDL